MKSILMTALSLWAILPAFAQIQKPEKGNVSISATAEREVTPDILYIEVSLREYFENNNTKKRISITQLENELMQSAKNAGINAKDITINSVDGINNQVKRRKNAEFLDSKSYRIKLNNLNNYNQFIDGIDSKGLVYSEVSSFEYSKKEQVKDELRVEAAKNAKAKAQILVGALGAKLGKIISLNENSFDENPPVMYSKNMMRMASAAMEDEAAPEIDFKTIKLRLTVNANFEIEE